MTAAFTSSTDTPAAPRARGQPRAFRLSIPPDEIDALRERLAHTRWPDQIPGDPWAYGRERAARETGSFTYRNAWLAEAGGEVAA